MEEDIFVTYETEEKKKKRGSAVKKESPYKKLKEWFFDSDNAELSEDIIRALNPISVLCLFGNLGPITIYLNKHFNNYNIYYLNPREIYSFLKKLVKENNIKWSDFSFYANEKFEKSLTEIHKTFPQLKRYEVYSLMELCKEDEEYESLQDSLGLTKYKVEKKKGRKKKGEK